MIDILLSTFNGSRFLQAQLDSIIGQTCCSWRVLIRDDGSTDATVEILNDYCKRMPKQFVLLECGTQNIGPCQSFGRLLSASKAPYVMFCDQDDVWLPEKIETSLAYIHKIEKEHGTEKPVLVHTDLTVVNNDLNTIAKSFWVHQRVKPALKAFNRILIQNVITGNTVIINRALATIAAPIPRSAVMHDWWVAIVASAFGSVATYDNATVLYRQHEKNKVGAKRWGIGYIMSNLANISEMRSVIVRAQIQAASFAKQYQGKLSPEYGRMAWEFGCLHEKNFAWRRYFIMKHQIFKNSFLKNLGLFLIV